MSIQITLESALALREKGALLVDARSPSEYADVTIPGAINVPLLDDAQRAEVGTIYKQVGRMEARRRAVALVAPKLPQLIEQVAQLQAETSMPVVVFCWRGGMRSLALTQFLELAGVPARQLEGGHKSFRRLVLDFFEAADWGRLLVLRGLTGVGKTLMLHRLAEQGTPILDLEGLANHRGSAFGNLGLPSQPSQKMFEALLWDKLRQVGPSDYVVTEGESRRIGRVVLPPKLYQGLQDEVSIWLNASLPERIVNILSDYPAVDQLKEQFVKPIQVLKDRLGKETVQRYLQLLESGEWDALVGELMVNYYDPLYEHTLPERRIEIELASAEDAVAQVKSAVETILATPRPAVASDIERA
ncbi:MAG: tRNA 2-selenouridine(34) synthase MnmH [Desulfuromonadales bacterium]|nr:tRNA 2-selenouridine(34) synthase MnmH [Desulfuromonadales bacterium]